MKRIIQIFLITFSLLLFSGVGFLFYYFNKPHKDISSEAPEFVMQAPDFFREFNANKDIGNKKFGNKIVEVSGRIVDVTSDDNGVSVLLNNRMEAVNCAFSPEYVSQNPRIMKLQPGNEISVKGKCDGFDIIMGIVLTRCVLVEQTQ